MSELTFVNESDVLLVCSRESLSGALALLRNRATVASPIQTVEDYFWGWRAEEDRAEFRTEDTDFRDFFAFFFLCSFNDIVKLPVVSIPLMVECRGQRSMPNSPSGSDAVSSGAVSGMMGSLSGWDWPSRIRLPGVAGRELWVLRFHLRNVPRCWTPPNA